MKKYALLFTLLTIGLGIAANSISSMKRWGSGDVINGRDLTRNFDTLSTYSWKKMSDSKIFFSTPNSSTLDAGVYAKINVGDKAGQPLLVTIKTLTTTPPTYPQVNFKCYIPTYVDDGGFPFTRLVNSNVGQHSPLFDGGSVGFFQFTTMIKFTPDAGNEFCGIDYTDPNYNVSSNIVIIENFVE